AFAPKMLRPRHLARHALADLFLDTWVCNAHTTASDALWGGVPVLTCPGETFASRVAASLLTAVGLPEMVAPSLESYQEIAVGLAESPGSLQQIRERLLVNRLTFPLFDTPSFTRNLEQAYLQMWQRQQAGLPPESFAVSASPPTFGS
ncbi:MAG: TIGR03032 family protein, partial [Magnetococcales bacterium]|nr:TIGR03032 family protein [Magnetococcales bacterium]